MVEVLGPILKDVYLENSEDELKRCNHEKDWGIIKRKIGRML